MNVWVCKAKVCSFQSERRKNNWCLAWIWSLEKIESHNVFGGQARLFFTKYSWHQTVLFVKTGLTLSKRETYTPKASNNLRNSSLPNKERGETRRKLDAGTRFMLQTCWKVCKEDTNLFKRVRLFCRNQVLDEPAGRLARTEQWPLIWWTTVGSEMLTFPGSFKC